MLPHRNPNFEQFIAPAKARAEGWRTGLGIAFLLVLIAILSYIIKVYGIDIAERYRLGFGYMLAAEMALQLTKRSVLLSLGVVILVLPLLWIMLKIVHRRGIRSLFGATGQIDARIFVIIFLGYAGVWLLIAGPGFALGQFTQQLDLSVWLLWFLPTAVFIFFQSLTEELIFRGYLLQQFAHIFRPRILWWVTPAIIFGALHYNPLYYGQNAWLVCFNAALFGLILSDITVRTGNISAAVALHFANNFFQVLVLGVPGVLSSTSLFLRAVDLQDHVQTRTVFLAGLGFTLLAYLIYLLVMRRRR